MKINQIHVTSQFSMCDFLFRDNMEETATVQYLLVSIKRERTVLRIILC